MQLPDTMKPALIGAGAGAVALAVIGFGWGGWVSAGSASEMSGSESMAAVATALTPYCVQTSQADPNAATVMAELDGASAFRRRGIIEEAGWATPLGAESANRALAEACAAALTAEE